MNNQKLSRKEDIDERPQRLKVKVEGEPVTEIRPKRKKSKKSIVKRTNENSLEQQITPDSIQ